MVQRKINQVFVYRGLKRVAVPEAQCGDIVVISGISDISIGETICDPKGPSADGDDSHRRAYPQHELHGKQVSVCRKIRKYVTSRHIRERLNKELEVNVGLMVEETDSTDCFKVSGRGELHLSILVENMRREGYELASKPEVILRKRPARQGAGAYRRK